MKITVNNLKLLFENNTFFIFKNKKQKTIFLLLNVFSYFYCFRE